MPKFSSILFRVLNYGLDFIGCVMAGLFGIAAWSYAYEGRFGFEFDTVSDFKIVLPFFLLLYLCVFLRTSLAHIYYSRRTIAFSRIFLVHTQAAGFSLMLSALTRLLFPVLPSSRALIFGITISYLFLALLKELLIRQLLRFWRARGFAKRRTLIVSSSPDLFDRLVEESEQDLLLGTYVAGFAALSEEAARCSRWPKIETTEDLAEILDTVLPDLVIVALDKLEQEGLIANALWLCEERGLDVWLKHSLLDRIIYRSTINTIRGMPFICFSGAPRDSFAVFVKYLFDRLISAVILVIICPMLVVIAAAIKLTSPGPVLFRQQRAGLNGRPFELLKFRSMVQAAEDMKQELQAQNEMSGPVFKIKNDPRVTPLGKWLRKFSLDELPQLWNVFRGEMSLVGPRPMELAEVENLTGWYRRKLSMKPGITCIWQTSGRNRIQSFDDWARLDLQYIDNWNLWLDFVLLLKTIPVVVFGRGAS